MTSIVNEMTHEAITTDPTATGVIALAVIFLLISLLILKEVLRATGQARHQHWMAALDVVIFPLVFVFVLTIITRFMTLI